MPFCESLEFGIWNLEFKKIIWVKKQIRLVTG